MNRNQAKQAKYEKLQSRADPAAYPRVWQASLLEGIGKNPAWCCFSTFCGCCASYSLRKQALYNDMSRYVCCNGNCPCSGRCGETNNPEFCLALEACCCFAQSVASTRWMIQDELRIQTTPCDNCIIGTMICMQYFSCICSIVACLTNSPEIDQLAQLLDCVADFLWCSVCACMQTQHKIELNVRDESGANRPPQAGGMQAPGVQAIPQPGAYQQGYPQQGYQQQGAYPPPPGAYQQPYGAPPPQQYGAPAGYPAQGMQR